METYLKFCIKRTSNKQIAKGTTKNYCNNHRRSNLFIRSIFNRHSSKLIGKYIENLGWLISIKYTDRNIILITSSKDVYFRRNNKRYQKGCVTLLRTWKIK